MPKKQPKTPPTYAKGEKHFLIEFNSNYADEFDVEGFIVMSESKWEAHKAYAKKAFKKEDFQEVYFGTNEMCSFSGYSDYMRALTVTELTPEQLEVLFQLFNDHREGYSYTHEGKTYVIPTMDVIRSGMLAMIAPEDDEDED